MYELSAKIITNFGKKYSSFPAMNILLFQADSSTHFGLRAEEMSYLDSFQCVVLTFCRVWFPAVIIGNKNTQLQRISVSPFAQWEWFPGQSAIKQE